MMIGALGDIHGEFDAVQAIMRRHADVPFWLQVGDVASNDGEYFAPAAPLYWIKGHTRRAGSRIQHAKRIHFCVQETTRNDAGAVLQSNSGKE